jgi:hypothetical protein
MQSAAILRGYERLPGEIPVVFAPQERDAAERLRSVLEAGAAQLSDLLDAEPPELEAFLVLDQDWERAPRESERSYPPGLPYFTRSARPPALVIPETLSPAIHPRTEATLPLTAWHELAHAFFLLQGEVVRTPTWLREFVPQVAAAALARRLGLPLEDHLARIDRDPGFTLRSFGGPASAGDQMSFQNLLLLLGAAALKDFGEGFLKDLAHALREERDVVDEERAEELLADVLGPGGREWLSARAEY